MALPSDAVMVSHSEFDTGPNIPWAYLIMVDTYSIT